MSNEKNMQDSGKKDFPGEQFSMTLPATSFLLFYMAPVSSNLSEGGEDKERDEGHDQEPVILSFPVLNNSIPSTSNVFPVASPPVDIMPKVAASRAQDGHLSGGSFFTQQQDWLKSDRLRRSMEQEVRSSGGGGREGGTTDELDSKPQPVPVAVRQGPPGVRAMSAALTVFGMPLNVEYGLTPEEYVKKYGSLPADMGGCGKTLKNNDSSQQDQDLGSKDATQGTESDGLSESNTQHTVTQQVDQQEKDSGTSSGKFSSSLPVSATHTANTLSSRSFTRIVIRGFGEGQTTEKVTLDK